MLYAPEEPDTDTLRVPVLRVFDGDGFLTRVRLPQRRCELEVAVRFGFIDAPELGQPGGREAKDFLSHLISGQWLDLVVLMKMDTGGIIDRHGRIVAVPYLKQNSVRRVHESSSIFSRLAQGLSRSFQMSRNIELEMVLNGWAWVLDRYEPDGKYFEALEDAQRQRRGIWARDDNLHPWDFKKRRYARRRRGSPNPQPVANELFAEPRLRCPSDGCDGNLVQRSGRYGAFYGCSKFPKCRYSCKSVE